MLYRKPILIIAVCSLALTVACSKKVVRINTATVNSTDIMNDSSLTSSQKAERLALAAEQLVSPGSFMYAQDVADMALSIDSGNKRAQLVKVLIAPLMATKGIMARIKPLAERNDENKADYQKALERLDEQPNHALKTFVLDGKADITSEKDIQNFNDSIRDAFNKQRLFFKANKNLDMTFNISDLFSAAAISNKDECYWNESDGGVYNQYCYEDNQPVVLEYKLNRADNEALQQISAGAQIYLTLLNSYDVSGSLAASEKYNSTGASFEVVKDELLKNKSFGTLRNNTLTNISALGMDAISGIRWAVAIQKELCPNGTGVSGSRPGHVFSKGVCIDDQKSGSNPLENVLKTIEVALSGGGIMQTFGAEKEDYTTEIRANVLMGSVTDIRNLALSFNECGNVIHAGDSTLGGTFPKRDANIVLNLSSTKCQNL